MLTFADRGGYLVLNLSRFAIQKAIAPNNGVEFLQGSIGAIKSTHKYIHTYKTLHTHAESHLSVPLRCTKILYRIISGTKNMGPKILDQKVLWFRTNLSLAMSLGQL